MRLAAPFEALRDKSDARLRSSGARPTIFLGNLGTPADFTARATFAKNFFETGGIEAIDTQGFTDPAALTAAWQACPASRKPRCVRPASAISSLPAVTRWQPCKTPGGGWSEHGI